MESSTATNPESQNGAGVADTAAYWLAIAGVYLSYLVLWYYSAYGKFVNDDAKMPEGLRESFDGTFLDSFPGLDVSWFLMALVQAVAFLVFAASVVTGEFLPRRRKPILLVSLGLSLLIFAALLFGSGMTQDFGTTGGLFGYVGTTAIVLILVLLMPPYRPQRWLSGLLDRSG